EKNTLPESRRSGSNRSNPKRATAAPACAAASAGAGCGTGGGEEGVLRAPGFAAMTSATVTTISTATRIQIRIAPRSREGSRDTTPFGRRRSRRDLRGSARDPTLHHDRPHGGRVGRTRGAFERHAEFGQAVGVAGVLDPDDRATLLVDLDEAEAAVAQPFD